MIADTKVRSELRAEMKRASQEIAKDPARMRAAEREGFAPKSKTSSARPNRNADGRRAGESRRTKGLSGKSLSPVKGSRQKVGHPDARRRWTPSTCVLPFVPLISNISPALA